jgi:hypothetical protein
VTVRQQLYGSLVTVFRLFIGAISRFFRRTRIHRNFRKVFFTPATLYSGFWRLTRVFTRHKVARLTGENHDRSRRHCRKKAQGPVTEIQTDTPAPPIDPRGLFVAKMAALAAPMPNDRRLRMKDDDQIDDRSQNGG